MHPDRSRYSCQVGLPDFGPQKQQLLQQAKVLVIGAGGLGCPAAQYLAATGIGKLGIADYDVVSESNLHRQILYKAADVGQKKAQTACRALHEQNPGIHILCHDIQITDENVVDMVWPYDVILDCTDNFATRYLINDACVFAGKPLIYGAIYQYEGQVAIWNVKNPDETYTPNYRDVYPDVNALEVPNCSDGGVLPTLAGIIGCMMANETAKLITGTGDRLVSKMLVFDARYMQSRTIKLGPVSNFTLKRPPKSEEHIPLLDHQELKNNFNDYFLVDVRTAEEHAQFNIGGMNIPLQEIDKLFDHLDNGKPIVLYCASGTRSAEAVKTILSLFQADICSLKNGIKNW